MTNTYLLEIIKAFSPGKRQEMALFLESNLFNRGKNAKEIIQLYQIILETAPDFSETMLDKGKVCLQIFGEPNIVPGKLEKLVADLNKHLRTYALFQAYYSENNAEQQQIDWSKWLRINGLAEPALKTILKLKSKNDTQRFESLEQYRTDLLISEEEHLWELTHNQVRGDLNIPNLIHYLDLYYYNYRTELGNRYLLQQKAAQLPDKDFSIIDEEAYQSKSVLLEISKKIFKILKNNTPPTLDTQELIQLLQIHEKVLSFQTLDHFYAYARNFCTLIIYAGNDDFIPILYQISKDNLERGYFSVNGKLPPHAYLNLVQIAIKALEFDWAKKFTESYKGLILGGDEGQFYYRHNMAQSYFAEGDFDQSLKYLPEVPSNFHYHHMIRRLELKIYYELVSDLLPYKIDAFRKFIERTATKTLSANLRAMDLNFLNILTQLSQSPLKDKARSARLITRIEGKKLLADRAWLLEKARELS